MFKGKSFSIGMRAIIFALLLMVCVPVTSFAQRRWVVTRSPRSRIVVYQPRSNVIYQRRPSYTYRTYTYGYPQSYYSTYYSNGYGYTEP